MPPLIGLSVALGPHGNLHSDTFLAAVAWWRARGAAAPDQLRFDLQSDDATHLGGHRVAQHFVKRGAACVVGHFASAAAFQALDTYARKALPVVLPAATDDRLETAARTPHGVIALRLSADNDMLMRRTAEQLQSIGGGPVHVYVESSSYARRLQVLLHRHAAPLGLALRETHDNLGGDVTCILGKEPFALHTLARFQQNEFRSCKVVVVDDAVTEAVRSTACAVPGLELTGVVAHTQLHRPPFYPEESFSSTTAQPFFWETVAALEIAALISQRPKGGGGQSPLTDLPYTTCLGDLQFAESGLLLGADVQVTALKCVGDTAVLRT